MNCPVTEFLNVTCNVPWNCWSRVRRIHFESICYHKLGSSPGPHPYRDRLAAGSNGHRSLEAELDTFLDLSRFSCLTGLPLISDPWSRSLALSAARRSNYRIKYCGVVPFAADTHVSHKYHASCWYQIKEGFDVTMFLKHASYVFTVRFIL